MIALLASLHREGKTVLIATAEQLAAAYSSRTVQLGPPAASPLSTSPVSASTVSTSTLSLPQRPESGPAALTDAGTGPLP